jgi:ABC-2 type transport system permease protein
MTAGRAALLAGHGPRRSDPGAVPAPRSRERLRQFWVSTVLGWKMEGNWTDPVLFVIYSVAKPVASALLLVLMLEVIGGNVSRDFRGFVVVGSALWAFVLSGIAGLAWTVLDDRERYRMLKYVYVSPADFLLVLIGRGVARLAVGAMGGAITLAMGVTFLGLSFDLARVDWVLLLVSMTIGVVAVLAIGVALAAICIQTRQESWSYPEAVGGALFLLSGAVFPLAVLPDPIELIAWLAPVTWWIAGVREALFPGGPSSIGGDGSLWTAVTGSGAPDAPTIVLALLVTGAVGTLAATVLFGISERRAKEHGLLDRTTGS